MRVELRTDAQRLSRHYFINVIGKGNQVVTGGGIVAGNITGSVLVTGGGNFVRVGRSRAQ